MDLLLKWATHEGWAIIVVVLIAFVARHFGGAVISQIIKRLIRKTRTNDMTTDDIAKRQNTLITLLTVIWKTFVIIVATLIIIKIAFGNMIDLTPLFASAGILGVALGFGAQSLIKDFLTGIFIISENQYRVGDVIDIEGATGSVERVGIRSTSLRDADGNVHYFPNGIITHVMNKTMGYSKVNFTLAVNPTTDLDKLAELINTIGEKMAVEEPWKDKILEPPHFVSINTFSETRLEISIAGKTQPSTQWGVTGELRSRLLRVFRKHHIELA